jgi:plasmid maintenance system antidote protein VapI
VTDKILELPLEEVALLASLGKSRDRAPLRARMVELHQAGYSYTAIAEGVGVTRQRVHQIVSAERAGPSQVQPRRKARKPVPPAIAETLVWAWTASASRRGSTVEGTLPAAAHRVLIDTITDLMRDKVTLAAVAEVLGVEEGTVRGRVLRAGVTRKAVRAEDAA